MTHPQRPISAPLVVSVVIPVYQGQDLILDTLASVLQQTYPHLEVIVVNDGSTDDTPQRLTMVTDPRVRVIHQTNQGVAVARNTGFQASTGTYIGFLDADDRWNSAFVEASLAALGHAPDPVAFSYSGYACVDEHNRLNHLPPVYAASGDLFKRALETEGMFLPSTTLMHRQVVETLGGFSAGSYHEDRVFFIRACRRFSAYPTRQRLVTYRQSLAGRCRSILADYDTALQAELSIVEDLKDALSESEQARLLHNQYHNLFYRFLMYGYLDSARKLLPFVDTRHLWRGKKGFLAMLSVITGLNILCACRKLVQWGYRVMPWPGRG